MILPTGQHLPSTTVALAMRTFSLDSIILDADAGLTALVQTLNELQPDFVSSYTGVISRLAHEQRAGRLAISPTDIQVSGEILFPAQRREIEDAFTSNVIDVYARRSSCTWSGAAPTWTTCSCSTTT
jgi:phenylacetate-coenzyme A ligase PaaK-like adenylate-forming protein